MMPSGGCVVFSLIFQAWLEGKASTFEPPRRPIPYDMKASDHHAAALFYKVDPSTIRFYGVGTSCGHVSVVLPD